MVNWDDISGYALYDTFAIGDESSGFMLTVSGYNGTAGRYICMCHVCNVKMMYWLCNTIVSVVCNRKIFLAF